MVIAPGTTRVASSRRSCVEIADILREHISDYKKKYNMPKEHDKAVCDMLSCRTAYLGGHIEQCDRCGHVRNAYNSCRNRHCPKCQTMAKERWLEARKADLLPVVYFHHVFTLPHELNPVILRNKNIVLSILFQSVSETLKQFGLNPDNGLGGRLGYIAILHTWDQKLLDHFHLHCLVPGGALSNDKTKWIACKYDYLFCEKALSKVFRGKFMDYFKQAFTSGKLIFPGSISEVGTSSGFKNLTEKLWSKEWVVYIKEPVKKPEYVLEYLARYTHRVAISNNRIKSLKNGEVTFEYKDRSKQTTKTMTLDAVEFIRRFLLHILPSGFVRIRHYGFLANRYKKENVRICRILLGLSEELPAKVNKSIAELMLTLTGQDIFICQVCKKGRMEKVQDIPKHSGENPFYILKPP